MNLSLVAALLSGFTLATLVASHTSNNIVRYGHDVTEVYSTYFGMCGGTALTLLIWCVLPHTAAS